VERLVALSASCLRAGGLRLSLALLLGLLLVPGFVVAPILFAKTGSTYQAGMLAGYIFHVANRTVVILALAVAAFWWRQGGTSRSAWIVLGLILLLVAVNEWAITPVIADLKAQIGHGFDTLPKDNPLRVRFGTWHGISAVLHLIATLCSAWLVAAGSGHRDEACARS
jgi:Domain of unknown function (DUF4149)